MIHVFDTLAQSPKPILAPRLSPGHRMSAVGAHIRTGAGSLLSAVGAARIRVDRGTRLLATVYLFILATMALPVAHLDADCWKQNRQIVINYPSRRLIMKNV